MTQLINDKENTVYTLDRDLETEKKETRILHSTRNITSSKGIA